MSFILKVSNINPPKGEVIQHLIINSQTPQDDVVIEYVDIKIPNGFTITKVDRVLSNIAKKEPELKDYLNIREHRFVERITAEENDRKIKEELDAGSVEPKPERSK